LWQICEFKLFQFIMQMAYEGLLDMNRKQKNMFLSMDIIVTNHNILSIKEFHVQGVSKNAECTFKKLFFRFWILASTRPPQYQNKF